MKIKINIGLFSLILLMAMSVSSSAQIDTLPSKELAGEKYYIYTVEEGNTVYSIHRKYNIPVQDIIKTNPGIEKGLSIGQKIYLPAIKISEGSGAALNIPDKGVKVHVVESGETVYGISRIYVVEIDEIYALNPTAKEQINPGDSLLIPTGEVSMDTLKVKLFGTNDSIAVMEEDTATVQEVVIVQDTVLEDSIILHKVRRKETLFSISKQYGVSIDSIRLANNGLKEGLKRGDEIKIPLKRKVVVETEEFAQDTLHEDMDTAVFKSYYNVAVLLPFLLDKNQEKIDNTCALCPVEPYPATLVALDFYHGVRYAIDSLTKAGLSVNLHVFDTQHDTAVTRSLLAKPEMKNMDLIIGPLFTSTLKIAASFAKKNQIPLICPVNQSNQVLFKNPYVIKSVTSIPSQVEYLAKYLAENYHHANIILVESEKSKDQYLVKLFKKVYQEEIKKYPNRFADSLKVISNLGSGGRNVGGYLEKDTTNIFVSPSVDLSYVSSLLTTLNMALNQNRDFRYCDCDIKVFGLEEWLKFEDIDEEYKQKLNVHYTASGFIDYDTTQTMEFISTFRSYYGTDPGKYAFMGFDITYYYLAGVKLFGNKFLNKINQLAVQPVHTNYYFKPSSEGSGLENQPVFILEYKDYELKRVN